VVGMNESHQPQVNVPAFIAIADALDAERQSYIGECLASEALVKGFAEF
jgi:2-methylcitrate dehydratase PrpD